ncbi:ABC transporter ATP-binding protein [Aurantimonas sp. VKM B-3413]|uniref:ABC transporter ATP-binding protein n=1 Tax=Aurantimonas sp. VKM B-3413 TaxID=2779401 RepID=UPI001E284CBB|nr:ABC transporter ATP-binding protein [Aurantimonas sp. VKM B-3413]
MSALGETGRATTPALQTTGLVKRFGGLVATNDVTLAIEKGARHALIGPNGAGKTTLINLLTGVLKPTHGTVALAGKDVTRLTPHQRARRGIARTFQINQLFLDMTPLETVTLSAAAAKGRAGVWWHGAARETESVERAGALLERFGLTDVMSTRVSSLPYGKQRLLEIAVAIASEPSVLLLDEPAAGVPEDERHEILAIVESLPKEVTVVLIEHDMDLVFSFADRITVLVSGAVFTEGTVAEISANPEVRRVYLGEGDA